MDRVYSFGEAAKEICDALGLRNVTMLNIHLSVDRAATVTAKFYPQVDGAVQAAQVLKRYRLEEIKGKE